MMKRGTNTEDERKGKCRGINIPRNTESNKAIKEDKLLLDVESNSSKNYMKMMKEI